jgi:hypothetical protein
LTHTNNAKGFTSLFELRKTSHNLTMNLVFFFFFFEDYERSILKS